MRKNIQYVYICIHKHRCINTHTHTHTHTHICNWAGAGIVDCGGQNAQSNCSFKPFLLFFLFAGGLAQGGWVVAALESMCQVRFIISQRTSKNIYKMTTELNLRKFCKLDKNTARILREISQKSAHYSIYCSQ